jgi:hypothetical protein
VPPSAYPGQESPTFAVAARYLDASLFEFLRELGTSGTLDDTLVIITADEGRGIPLSTDIPDMLTQNWGPLLMLLPTRESMTLTEPYAQSDVAISILDFLGIDSSETGFIGRSLFRKYATPRRIYFSNVFLRHSGAVDSTGNVLWCKEQGNACSKFSSDPSMLFMPIGEGQAAYGAEVSELQYVIQRTLGKDEPERREHTYTLIGNNPTPLFPISQQTIMGGQNFSVPERSRIEVAIECDLEGGNGEVVLDYTLAKKDHEPFYQAVLPPVSAGDRITLHLELDTLDSIRNLRFKIYGSDATSEELLIRFDTAVLKIAPIPEGEVPEEARFLVEPNLQILSSGNQVEMKNFYSNPNPRAYEAPN